MLFFLYVFHLKYHQMVILNRQYGLGGNLLSLLKIIYYNADINHIWFHMLFLIPPHL